MGNVIREYVGMGIYITITTIIPILAILYIVRFFEKKRAIKKQIKLNSEIQQAFSTMTQDTNNATAEETNKKFHATTPISAQSMSSIQEWYANHSNIVSEMLPQYAMSFEGISSVTVTDIKFWFGNRSGWHDCHYTLSFSCEFFGSPCNGNARAFTEYKGSDVIWINFEVYRMPDNSALIDYYDENAMHTVEDYYKELETHFS